MKKFYFALVVFVISLHFNANGQTEPSQTSGKDYENKAAVIRAEVWAWDIPAFSNYSVPEAYKDESAVILARHRQIDATAKKSSFGRAFFTGSDAGKLFYTDIERRMIKINDQAALDKFSEFSFKETHKYGITYTNSNVTQTIIGARIIKPDGSVTEVDVSGVAVSMTEGRNDKEAYKKLAIPSLQKGDILDFFVCEIYELTTFNMPPQYIPFFSIDYPALNYSCELTFGKNLTVEYRSINGAPTLTKYTDGENNVVLKAEANGIMRINDYENLRWLSPFRDLPMIRFAVLQNASKAFFKPKSARPLGVYENVSPAEIIEDAKWFLACYKFRLSLISPMKKKVSEIITNYKKDNSGISLEELADVIYAALNFEWSTDINFYYNPGTFILMLDQLLKDNGIESKIGFAIHKKDARNDEVLTDDDLQYIVTANNDNRFYFLPYRYRVPGAIPALFEGESASTFTLNKISSNAYGPTKIDFGQETLVTIPESQAKDNVNLTRIEASIVPEDNQKLAIKRNMIWTGALKNEIQPALIIYENWDTTMRSHLCMDKSLMDELNAKRKTRKLTDQIAGNLEKTREEYVETMKQEIFTYHNSKPQEIGEYSFASFGVTTTAPQLEYDVNYIMDGFVRTAGDNLILDVGKLIGIQWNPTDNDRDRRVDAYIPTAMIFENEIGITIPDGYSAGEINNMNVNYSNEYLSFEASAVINGNKIVIKTKKTYLKAFVPKEDWGMMMEIIDKTNLFYSNSIIFERKG